MARRPLADSGNSDVDYRIELRLYGLEEVQVNPEWLPFVDMMLGWAFGFVLLVILGYLARTIALGNSEAAHSFGLDFILGALSALAGGFSQSRLHAMFSNRSQDASNEKEPPKES